MMCQPNTLVLQLGVGVGVAGKGVGTGNLRSSVYVWACEGDVWWFGSEIGQNMLK